MPNVVNIQVGHKHMLVNLKSNMPLSAYVVLLYVIIILVLTKPYLQNIKTIRRIKHSNIYDKSILFFWILVVIDS